MKIYMNDEELKPDVIIKNDFNLDWVSKEKVSYIFRYKPIEENSVVLINNLNIYTLGSIMRLRGYYPITKMERLFWEYAVGKDDFIVENDLYLNKTQMIINTHDKFLSWFNSKTCKNNDCSAFVDKAIYYLIRLFDEVNFGI